MPLREEPPAGEEPDEPRAADDEHVHGEASVPQFPARRGPGRGKLAAIRPTTSPTPAAAPPDAPSPWLGFSAVGVGVFMATLDGSIVNVALPTMRRDLGTTIGGVEWVVTIYLLVVTGALLAAGRLGDILGHRRVYVAGMLLFTLGSGLCALAPSLWALSSARAVQALGASAMMAMAPAAITAVFPARLRGRALGGITTVVALGLTAGPPLGGLLVAHLSWRAIFTVNLPVGLAGVVWAGRALPRGAEAPGARFDARAAAWMALALGGAVGALEAAPRWGAGALALLAASAVGAALLVRHERGHPSPLLDASLFESAVFRWGLAAGLLSYAAMFTQTLLTPFFLAQVKGLGPGEMGLMLIAVPLALSLSSTPAGWLSDRFGPRGPCLAGMGVLAAALGSLAAAGPADSLPSIFARLALAGAGMGLFQPPNNSAVMGTLPRERLGSGGGLLATARYLGMAAGVALGGALFTLGSGAGGGAPAFLAGWRHALGAGAALAVAAGLLSLARR